MAGFAQRLAGLRGLENFLLVHGARKAALLQVVLPVLHRDFRASRALLLV